MLTRMTTRHVERAEKTREQLRRSNSTNWKEYSERAKLQEFDVTTRACISQTRRAIYTPAGGSHGRARRAAGGGGAAVDMRVFVAKRDRQGLSLMRQLNRLTRGVRAVAGGRTHHHLITSHHITKLI
jgi:hypothetical protein